MVEEGPSPLDNLDLEGLFADIAKGNFGLYAPQQQQSQEQSPASKSLKASFIEGCIITRLPQMTMRSLKESYDIRSIAEYFRWEYTSWKSNSVQAYLEAKREAEAEIISSIIYADMTKFAKDRFDESSKESGHASPFGDRRKQMQRYADYWGWVEQVIREAEDQEKKNPN